MEIPDDLKSLYRHWGMYISPIDTPVLPSELFEPESLFEELVSFINQRLDIWKKKYNNETLPYTDDPILSTYRFCNILREFDRQTIEFHAMLNPLRDDLPLWLLNMFYCRMVASTETVSHVGLLSFDADQNESFYKRFVASPRPRFGTPYVFPVSTIMKSNTPTRELFIAEYLPAIMPVIAAEIATWHKLSVYEGVQKLLPLFGYNHHFLWTEVLIDLAYQFPQYIDLFKQFPVGPGSLPTMRRINSKKDPSHIVKDLAAIELYMPLTYNSKPLHLSAENWEGVGCEFRKYTNLKEGKGRKRLFR